MLKETSYLILFQFYSRILTFVLGNILLRYTNPDVMGLSAIRFDVYTATVLFISREAIRLAMLRTPRLGTRSSMIAKQRFINMAWLVLPIGISMTLLLGIFYWLYPPSNDAQVYRESLYLYGIACIIELFCEPVYALVQNRSLLKVRVAIDSIALFCRSLVNFGVLYYFNQKYEKDSRIGILAFAYAQLSHSTVIMAGYLFYGLYMAGGGGGGGGGKGSDWPISSMKDLLFRYPSARKSAGSFDTKIVAFAFALFKQNILKHMLTQGDLFVLSILAPLNDQGIYAVVNNYGSLVARIIFQPLEEITRTNFSKLLGSQHLKSASQERKLDAVPESLQFLSTILKFNIYLGLFFCCIGANYTNLFVDLILGQKWVASGTTAQVLSAYCYYILIMGVNGILEAFVHAVMNEKEADTWSFYMICLSAAYIAMTTVLINTVGTIGMIFANCLNMIIRIILCMRYIKDLAGTSTVATSIWQCLPHPSVSVAFLAGLALTFLTSRFLPVIAHLAFGITYVCLLFSLIFMKDRAFLTNVSNIFFDKQVNNKKSA